MSGPIFVKGDGLPCWQCAASVYADCAHRPAERSAPRWMTEPAKPDGRRFNNPNGWNQRKDAT